MFWIKLHKKISSHWLWDDKPFSRGQAFIDLLILADDTDHKGVYRGQVVNYKRGDVNMSLLELSDRWGWSRGKTKRFLECLQVDGMVNIKRTQNRTVVTIENYSVYQDTRTPNGHQTDTKRTIDGQQTDSRRTHSKSIESIKSLESKREYITPPIIPPKGEKFIPPTVEEVRDFCLERNNGIDAEAFVDFYQSKGWYVGKNKMKDWKAAVRTWERSNRKQEPNRKADFMDL